MDVLVVDLIQLEADGVKPIFVRLMKDGAILKVGHSAANDLKAVSERLCCRGLNAKSIVDVKSLYSRLWHMGVEGIPWCSERSLNAMMGLVLGKELDKQWQCSAWGDRPLTPDQVLYAANDAACLVDLFVVCLNRYKKCGAGEGEEVDVRDFGQDWTWRRGKLYKERRSAFWSKKLPMSMHRDVMLSKKKKVGRNREGLVGRGSAESVLPAFVPWIHSTDKDVKECEIKFLVDVMLYGLARQLRLWGIDAEALPTLDKSQRHVAHRRMVEVAEEERRVILTKDVTFYSRHLSDQTYFVLADDKKSQLEEIIRVFGLVLEESGMLSRCPQCNGNFVDQPVSPACLPENHVVPQGVLDRISEFWVCARCSATYWQGSQYDRAMEMLHKEFRKLTCL